jgi:peptidoglycan hydrolase-like protein with peptidoglycan-binding domain
MWSSRVNLALVLIAVFAANPAFAAELSPDTINSAEPSKKSLSKDKATPAGVRLQVLLDRAHFSPGEIDGKFGENARKALRAYAEAQQLPSADRPTEEVWKALRADDRSATSDYTITEKDVAGPFLEKLPPKMEDMKDIPKLGYTSPREAIAEKFHMSEQLLKPSIPGRSSTAPAKPSWWWIRASGRTVNPRRQIEWRWTRRGRPSSCSTSPTP